MHYQTDKDLNPLRDGGCYFISLVDIAETLKKSAIPSITVLEVMVDAVRAGYLDLTGLCKRPAKILGLLGIEAEQKLNASGEVSIPLTYTLAPDEVEVLEFYDPVMKTHFSPGDGQHKLRRDVYSKAGSPIIRQGVLRSLRVFKIKKVA